MKAGHLYVIGDGGGVVKIGRAANPAGRLSSLQVGSSRPLSLLHVFPEAGRMEREVHGRLKGLHVHREWFDFGGDDPVMAVRDAIADIKSPRCKPTPDAESVERQRRRSETREAARSALRSWRRRCDAVAAGRDRPVFAALDAGLSKVEIREITGLCRNTIYRIAPGGGSPAMSTEKADAARSALRSWRRRRDTTDTERDPLVAAALDAGLLKEEVHVITGLGRTTIDRIAARAAQPEGDQP